MEKRKIRNNCSNGRVRINRGGMEAKTSAILDSAESHKDSQDAKDVMRSDREATRKNSCELFDSNSLGNMLLFQYLINVLEGDFLPCINIYKETMNWNLWRECLLNKFLCYLLFLTFLHISLNGLSYFLTESSIWLLMLDLVSFWILLHFRYDAIELTALSIEFKC
ncbi:uncharacterized protein LOC111278157 isoform X1 [Durio zibethinus]|uniref:Uncharacterized protein LOC111278157 isoform X1 n=1 Tax=Durio zibethinus TaxID=66656 RepID=A0A6P5WXR0_DURZI|nr:uncharacterized protein LOC111278157 isoform X1 [Durio zibethinus]